MIENVQIASNLFVRIFFTLCWPCREFLTYRSNHNFGIASAILAICGTQTFAYLNTSKKNRAQSVIDALLDLKNKVPSREELSELCNITI
jgi:hypothetical protein